MKRSTWFFIVAALALAMILKNIEWPNAIFACLAIVIGAAIIYDMFQMCDNLLDPPPAIFYRADGIRRLSVTDEFDKDDLTINLCKYHIHFI